MLRELLFGKKLRISENTIGPVSGSPQKTKEFVTIS